MTLRGCKTGSKVIWLLYVLDFRLALSIMELIGVSFQRQNGSSHAFSSEAITLTVSPACLLRLLKPTTITIYHYFCINLLPPSSFTSRYQSIRSPPVLHLGPCTSRKLTNPVRNQSKSIHFTNPPTQEGHATKGIIDDGLTSNHHHTSRRLLSHLIDL